MIENLLSNNPSNSPPEVENPPPIENIPTTPITPDYSPSPSPTPNKEPLPTHEPPISTPPDMHQATSSTQQAKPKIPPTNEDQQLGNQPHGNKSLTEP